MKMKTCEEYVLNELKETKEELEKVKNDKKVLEEVLAEHKTLIDLVVNGVKDFKIKDDGTCLMVYWQDIFVTLERKDNLVKIRDLVALVERGQSILNDNVERIM